MSRLLPAACLALFAVAADQASCRGQAFVEHLSPPALQRGKTTRCTVAGTHLQQALDLWTALPPGALRATRIDSRADAAVFDVRIADDAPVGLFGLRVATVDGLSNVHLCLIDDLPLFAVPSRAAAEAAPPSEAELLMDAVKALHPDEMTPREALDALYALKAKLPKR